MVRFAELSRVLSIEEAPELRSPRSLAAHMTKLLDIPNAGDIVFQYGSCAGLSSLRGAWGTGSRGRP